MTLIPSWSTTAASNTSEFPENQAPSTLNNGCREVQAAVRTQHEQACWIDLGDTPTRTSDTQFTVVGDQTAQYTVGRRIRITDTSTLYGVITVSAYTTLTTVTVSLDSGAVTTPTAVAVGILDANIKYATTSEVTSAISVALPSRSIILWSGAVSAIPTGWVLCDGNNLTPDLREKMVVGAGTDASGATIVGDVGDTGGTGDWKTGVDTVAAHQHTTGNQSASHTHPQNVLTGTPQLNTGGATAYSAAGASTGDPASIVSTGNQSASHTHTTTGANTNEADWIGKYYTLAYIMKA